MEKAQDETGAAGGVSALSAGLGVGANLPRDPNRLDFVLMPLVRMLAEQQLSWSQREQVAHAMLATMNHHKGMADEAQMLATAAQEQCKGMSIGTGMAPVIRFRAPEELKAAAEEKAARTGEDLAEVMRELLRRWVARK